MAFWDIHKAIAQVEKCGFECEGGPLVKNAGWIWLKELAEGPRYRIGQTVPHLITHTTDAGFKLSGLVRLTIVGVKMSSGSDGRLWVYDLSKDPPDAYHYGSSVTVANVAEATINAALYKLG